MIWGTRLSLAVGVTAALTAAAMSIVNFALVLIIIIVFLRVNGWNRTEAR